MNLFMMAQHAGKSNTKRCSSSAEPTLQSKQSCCSPDTAVQVCHLVLMAPVVMAPVQAHQHYSNLFFFKFQLLLPLRASHAPLPTLFPRRDRHSSLQLSDGRVVDSVRLVARPLLRWRGGVRRPTFGQGDYSIDRRDRAMRW